MEIGSNRAPPRDQSKQRFNAPIGVKTRCQFTAGARTILPPAFELAYAALRLGSLHHQGADDMGFRHDGSALLPDLPDSRVPAIAAERNGPAVADATLGWEVRRIPIIIGARELHNWLDRNCFSVVVFIRFPTERVAMRIVHILSLRKNKQQKNEWREQEAGKHPIP